MHVTIMFPPPQCHHIQIHGDPWGRCSLMPVSALPREPHTMPLAGVVSRVSPAFKAADKARPLVDVRLEGFVLYLKYTWKALDSWEQETVSNNRAVSELVL